MGSSEAPNNPPVSLLAIAVPVPSGYRAVVERVDTHSGSVVESPVIVTYNGLVIELLVPVKHIKASTVFIGTHQRHRYASLRLRSCQAPKRLRLV